MRIFTLFSLLLIVSLLGAQDCVDDFGYYRTVNVDNTSGEALVDYQVVFELNTAQLVTEGKMRADGADLRVFSSDCTPLPFWGDSLGISTTTRIWVKVPALAGSATLEFQVYYGNSLAAPVLDGDATFLAFDDFNAGTVDPAKWETVGAFGTFEVVDGVLNYASSATSGGPRFKFARTVQTFSERVIFDYVGAVSNNNGFGFNRSGGTELDRLLFRQAGFGFDTINQVAIMQDTFSNGFAIENTYPLLRFERSAFNTASVTVGANDDDLLSFTRFANVGLGMENTDEYIATQIDSVENFHFILSSFSNSTPALLDNFRVRQFTPVPPPTMLGEEVFLDPSRVYDLLDASRVSVFPNPAKDWSRISIEYDAPVRLRVFDAQGRHLAGWDRNLAPGQQITLATDEFASGIYFLQFVRVADGAILHTRRLITE